LPAWLTLKRLPGAGLRLDRLFIRLPLIGAVYRDLAVALTCKTFQSLHRANQPAPQIIDLCASQIGNRFFRAGLLEIKRKLTAEGATLGQAFSESGLFPPLACLAIDVGEQSGQIAPAMGRVAEHLQTQARQRMDAAVGMLNPALTILVVGGVGLVLVAFFQAIYQVVYVSH
jgi:type IV pilus assembly protein PilC